MKFAVQERIQHSTDMDTSELSGWYSGYNGIEEVQDYSSSYYDGYNPWLQGDYGYGDGFELNAVAFGKAKGKGKAKGFQGKGYQSFGAKGQKGFQEKGKGKGGKGKGKGGAFSSLLKRNAAGMTVFTGTCYECGVIGHTGKYCHQRDPSTGYNGTCTLCGLWGHESKVCPKTVAEVTLEEAHGVSI